MALILASASPRRAALLAAAGLAFTVVPVEVDETVLAGESAEACVRRLARLKAASGAARYPADAVLAADTVVVVDGDILNKPACPDEAASMMRRLGGRTHEVLTGLSLVRGGDERSAIARSLVRFNALAPEEIAWYVATPEPYDKAGGYAVQGLASRFVAGIEGSYSNVVGLPVDLVYRLLLELGEVRPGSAPQSASR
jgi:septum formation protein